MYNYVVAATVVDVDVALIAAVDDGATDADKAHVWLKDSIFEPSNPIRHAIKLLSSRKNEMPNGAEMIYTDGGLDHNISFLNFNIAWLAYFLLSRCDTLIVGRTTPTQSELDEPG